MKNVILYYYNLEVSHIRQIDSHYYLLIDNENYLFTACDIERLKTNIKYLNSFNMHTIITATNDLPYVFYNNAYYVLLKLKGINKQINLTDIFDWFTPIDVEIDIKSKWIKLWSDHIDYIEFQMSELKNKYPYLSLLVDYYIGMTETAIQFLKSLPIDKVDLYFTHLRIGPNSTFIDLYNPCELVIDSRVRDISEFIKGNFFLKNITEVNAYSNILNLLDEKEKCLLFTRMLYPSYFFDLYDEIIKGKEDEDCLKVIVSKSVSYEKFLKDLFYYIKKTTYIRDIDWIIH